VLFTIELFFKPNGHGHDKRAKPPWGIAQIRFQQTLNLTKACRKKHLVNILEADSAFLQEEIDGIGRKPGIVLFAGKPLFLRAATIFPWLTSAAALS